jgi:DNA-binding response OmpR family regulator
MSSAKILVVDDEPQIRRMLRSALTKLGYVVADARSGEDALEKIRQERFDLIILDRNMPGIGGLAACREIRSRSDVGIIMLTVRKAEADKIEALDAGADDYVTKPFSMPELSARIRANLRRCDVRRNRGQSGDPSCFRKRTGYPAYAEGVRRPPLLARESQCGDSPRKDSAGGLGTGLWQRSRVSTRLRQPATKKDRAESLQAEVHSHGAMVRL